MAPELAFCVALAQALSAFADRNVVIEFVKVQLMIADEADHIVLEIGGGCRVGQVERFGARAVIIGAQDPIRVLLAELGLFCNCFGFVPESKEQSQFMRVRTNSCQTTGQPGIPPASLRAVPTSYQTGSHTNRHPP